MWAGATWEGSGAVAAAPRSRSSAAPGEAGPDLVHRGRVLGRGEALAETGLHQGAEGVEVEVEGLGHEALAPRHRGAGQREEALHRLLDGGREARSGHHAVHEPELLG